MKDSNPHTYFKLITLTFALILAAFFSGDASASTVDIKQNMRHLVDILLSISPFIGFLVFSSGVYQFYKHAKTRDERYGTASSVFKIISGSLLVSVNWFFGLLSTSFISTSAQGDDNSRIMLAIDQQMAEGAALISDTIVPQDTIQGLLGFVAFVGVLAFVNGIVALKNIGDGRHDERDIYKALTRIIGGLICVNIKWVSCFAGSIFGVSILC